MRGAQLFFMAGIIALSFTAEKYRQLVGEESSSKSSKERFSFLNCFDMSYGTMACLIKECLKLYLYYLRAVHVQETKAKATEASLKKNLSRGQNFEEAIKTAREVGNAAARRASLQVKHIMGPAVSSGWDLFETLYVGGTLTEGVIRGIGTFFGAYIGGIMGEGNLKWFGFLVGSQLGSLLGGRIGLMLHDAGKGVQFLLHRASSNASKSYVVF